MANKSQQAFESAFKEIFPQWIKFERDSLGYQSPSVESGFKLWQSSRKQALEEAIALISEHGYISRIKMEEHLK